VDIFVMRLSASWCHFRQCPWDGGCKQHGRIWARL